MVTDADIHRPVVPLVAARGHAVGTEGILMDVTAVSAVVEIERPDDHPDLVLVSCDEVRPVDQETKAA